MGYNFLLSHFANIYGIIIGERRVKKKDLYKPQVWPCGISCFFMEGKETRQGDFNRVAMATFLQFSGWIAIPIIMALFAGNWLDEKFKTEPLFTLTSIGAAFITTIVGLVKKGKKMMKEINKQEKEQKNSK